MAKAASNARKHGVRFSEATIALQDAGALTVEDPESVDEDRFVSIGADDTGRVLVAVYTYRGESIRIISSRRANRRERQFYEDAW